MSAPDRVRDDAHMQATGRAPVPDPVDRHVLCFDDYGDGQTAVYRFRPDGTPHESAWILVDSGCVVDWGGQDE